MMTKWYLAAFVCYSSRNRAIMVSRCYNTSSRRLTNLFRKERARRLAARTAHINVLLTDVTTMIIAFLSGKLTLRTTSTTPFDMKVVAFLIRLVRKPDDDIVASSYSGVDCHDTICTEVDDTVSAAMLAAKIFCGISDDIRYARSCVRGIFNPILIKKLRIYGLRPTDDESRMFCQKILCFLALLWPEQRPIDDLLDILSDSDWDIDLDYDVSGPYTYTV